MKRVLETYGLSFSVLGNVGNRYLSIRPTQDNDDNISLLNNFLCDCGFDFLKEDILPDVNKALNNENFDLGEWSTESDYFFVIGRSTCTISNGYSPDVIFKIPTQDIKEIFEAWINWVMDNNLQKYIK